MYRLILLTNRALVESYSETSIIGKKAGRISSPTATMHDEE